MLDIVKHNKTLEFRAMLEAGLSPNACNAHGESLLHMVCRHGQVRMFRILVEFFVDPRQTDDCGRTPLHEACLSSAPSFEIIRWLIRSDPGFLFLIDERGSLPLDLVNKSLWPQFHQFIEHTVDEFFPKSNSGMDISPGLCNVQPNSRPVRPAWNAISPFLARQVASGALAPHEVSIEEFMPLSDKEDDSSYSSESECSSYTSDDDDETDYPSLFDDASEFALFENMSNAMRQ